ncbi:hypothetical protein ACFLTL_01235, partial [Chloroflexota bacterium]
KGNKYSKAEYEVKVKGEQGRIVSLIGRIEGTEFATLTVEDIEIKFIPENTTGDVVTKAYWEGEFTIVTLYQLQGT